MERINGVVNSVRGTISETVANKGVIVVFVILTLILIAFIIGYIIWRLNRNELKGKELLVAPRKLFNKPSFKYGAYRLPAMYMGQEFTFSFWLYITDFQTTSRGKLILLRQPPVNAGMTVLSGANPVVFMDASVNKMYICVGTKGGTGGAETMPQGLSDIVSQKASPVSVYLVATIEYVPLQRWVNIAFSVQETTLTVYMDGSIYTAESLYDMKGRSQKNRPMFAACDGDVSIGNSISTISDDLFGFIARVQFFNYALSIANASALYRSGPMSKNVLRRFGVPDYGVRSPIYRKDDEGDNDDFKDDHSS